MFKIGDLAVYPAHGVGVIESYKKTVIAGQERSFLVMTILDNSMTIMIPQDNVEKVGLRKIIAPEKVEELFDILTEKEVTIEGKPWNKRFREYSERIKTGVPTEIAGVLRELVALKNEKGLSFGERKMFENVKSLLTREISIATKNSVESVSKQLTKVLDN